MKKKETVCFPVWEGDFFVLRRHGKSPRCFARSSRKRENHEYPTVVHAKHAPAQWYRTGTTARDWGFRQHYRGSVIFERCSVSPFVAVFFRGLCASYQPCASVFTCPQKARLRRVCWCVFVSPQTPFSHFPPSCCRMNANLLLSRFCPSKKKLVFISSSLTVMGRFEVCVVCSFGYAHPY